METISSSENRICTKSGAVQRASALKRADPTPPKNGKALCAKSHLEAWPTLLHLSRFSNGSLPRRTLLMAPTVINGNADEVGARDLNHFSHERLSEQFLYGISLRICKRAGPFFPRRTAAV